MATVTVQVDEEILAKATEVLARRASSVAQEVQETLRKVAEGETAEKRPKESFAEFMQRFPKFDTGGPYSRDEMNER
jgi:hypothetical protein